MYYPSDDKPIEISLQIESLLRQHLIRYGGASLTKTLEMLAQQMGSGVECVAILDSRGKPIHGRTLFEKALFTADSLEIRFRISGVSDPRRETYASSVESDTPPQNEGAPPNGESSERTGPLARPRSASFVSQSDEKLLIQKLDMLEKTRNGWTAAGVVVKQLLPALEFSPEESPGILLQLQVQEIVFMDKRPNPNNPDHPTTAVVLNRQHPRVIAALADGIGSRSRITVSGQPVSETIIKDRR